MVEVFEDGDEWYEWTSYFPLQWHLCESGIRRLADVEAFCSESSWQDGIWPVQGQFLLHNTGYGPE